MTEVKAKELLDRVGLVQAQRSKMCCPRCGKDEMQENLYHNAYSRHAECYICSACGTDEALRDFAREPLPLSQWDFVKMFSALCENGGAE